MHAEKSSGHADARESGAPSAGPDGHPVPDDAARILARLIDVHGFGGWRIFLDDEPVPETALSYEPENTPPWIIHREDLKAINDLYRRLVSEISSADIPEKDPHRSEGFLVFVGGCIISKVILLVHCLLLTYNYYKVKTIPYPGRAASSYLNPGIVPDLQDALALAVFILFAHRDEHPGLRTLLLGDLYAVMKVFFDVLNGMLPCEEVARLREAYDVLHATGGAGETFSAFFERLQEVSRRFAAEEPKWERERAESTYTQPVPGIANAGGVIRLAAAGSRPRKRVPVKLAAAIFEVHVNTIGNWDKGKGRPPEYPGRNVDESLLRAAAETLFLRKCNEKKALANQAEGLTHLSAESRSITDSTRRECNRGNFVIGTLNGRKTPV